jgi:dTDP-4-amino-4,6-dideoxygalactose transaminase
VGVGSGTDALVLLLRAHRVGPGDEVIVPAMTFAATAMAVAAVGATPVLVDVRADDALLDPDLVEAAITPATKALLPVHLYGRLADVDRLGAIAQARGLLLLEDAAQAHGARRAGGTAGSLGDGAAFSFYPGKNLGAYGDGGAVTTSDPALAERLRVLRNVGSPRKYHHTEVAYNSRLDTLHAAVLEVKLRHLPAWNEARARHAAAYTERLQGAPGLTPPPPPAAGEVHAWHLYTVRCRDRADRDARLARLHAAGVGAGIHYPFALHQLAAYADLRRPAAGLPAAEDWAARGLSLPLFPELSEAQQGHVVATLLG